MQRWSSLWTWGYLSSPHLPWWKVSKIILKLCFLAETFLQVKFSQYEVWYDQYALESGMVGVFKGKNPAWASEGQRETNLLRPCLFLLLGTAPAMCCLSRLPARTRCTPSPVLAGTASTAAKKRVCSSLGPADGAGDGDDSGPGFRRAPWPRFVWLSGVQICPLCLLVVRPCLCFFWVAACLLHRWAASRSALFVLGKAGPPQPRTLSLPNKGQLSEENPAGKRNSFPQSRDCVCLTFRGMGGSWGTRCVLARGFVRRGCDGCGHSLQLTWVTPVLWLYTNPLSGFGCSQVLWEFCAKKLQKSLNYKHGVEALPWEAVSGLIEVFTYTSYQDSTANQHNTF